MKVLLHAIILTACVPLMNGLAQPLDHKLELDSLLRANSFALSVDKGMLRGEGARLILEAAQSAQIISIAEEHNVWQLNEFTRGLFDTLSSTRDFRFLALEQGPVVTRWMNRAARAGGIDSISRLVQRYPQAPTFATDEELRLIDHVARTSDGRYDAVWGLDQELGAFHILDRLAAIAPNERAESMARRAAMRAWKYEGDRFGDTLYLAQVSDPSDFAELRDAFDPKEGSEAEFLIRALEKTSRIFYNHALGQRGFPTLFESVSERELWMKQRFMEEYRRAQRAGISLPRIILKMGHWHVMRGIFLAHVSTTGEFADQFALSNGMSLFLLSTHVVDGPEQWRNSKTFSPLAIPGAPFTIIDFRPLRPYAHQKKINGLTDAWIDRIFRIDAALIVRGGGTGSYSIVRGK